MNMDKELIAKAKEAKNVEKLLVAAKEIGVELSKEQAEEYFAQIKKLSDEELEAVAGGGMALFPERVHQFNNESAPNRGMFYEPPVLECLELNSELKTFSKRKNE